MGQHRREPKRKGRGSELKKDPTGSGGRCFNSVTTGDEQRVRRGEGDSNEGKILREEGEQIMGL